MVTETKREALHRKIDLVLEQLNGKAEKLRPILYDVLDTLLDETQELYQRKAESSDVHALILEMREGFRRMDERFLQMEKRFEQVDKRFAELLHYLDKRLEQVDKRFDEINKRFEQVDKRIEQVDKRFEQVEKRIEQVDKRFESMDARFNRLYHFLMWMTGLMFTGFLGIYLKLFF